MKVVFKLATRWLATVVLKSATRWLATVVLKSATRWLQIQWFPVWPPGGCRYSGSQFGHQVTPLSTGVSQQVEDSLCLHVMVSGGSHFCT